MIYEFNYLMIHSSNMEQKLDAQENKVSIAPSWLFLHQARFFLLALNSLTWFPPRRSVDPPFCSFEAVMNSLGAPRTF